MGSIIIAWIPKYSCCRYSTTCSTRSSIRTAAQNSNILKVLAVWASGLQPSITSSSARRNYWTRFSTGNRTQPNIIFYTVPGTKDRILKRVRISHLLVNKDLASGLDMIIFSKWKTSAVYDILRCDWSVFLIELTTLGRIHTPQQPSFHSTGENRRRAELSKFTKKINNKAKSPGYATIWYQERCDTPRRRV